MLVRRPDWRSRLSAHIEASLERPFEWGVHDCCLFAADAVLAMTGTDLAEGWRGRYRTAIGARRCLRKLECSEPADLGSGQLRRVGVLEAFDGDIAALIEDADSDWGAGIGIVVGAHVIATGVDHLVFAPRSAARFAFHVPFTGEPS